jgi:hypothetical protein
MEEMIHRISLASSIQIRIYGSMNKTPEVIPDNSQIESGVQVLTTKLALDLTITFTLLISIKIKETDDLTT